MFDFKKNVKNELTVNPILTFFHFIHLSCVYTLLP